MDSTGLFGGLSIGQNIFLPGNDVLQDYSIAENPCLFKFKCTAFQPPEIKIKNNQGKIDVTRQILPDPLAEFEFIFNQETFTLSHSHRWNQPGGIVGKLKNLYNEGFMGVGGDTILQSLASTKLVGQGKEAAIRNEWNAFGAMDLAKSYQGTDSPDINISFVLFTTTHPLRDVVLPSMYLTYLSYPRLKKTKDEINEMLNLLFSSITSENLQQSQTVKKDNTSSASENLQKEIENMVGVLDDVIGDKWRYRLGVAPPYWVISSSNGLVHLNNSALTNVNVVYHGPWIGTSEVSLSQAQKISNLYGGKDQKTSNKNTIRSDQAAYKSGMNTFKAGGFPSWAEVTLTFRNNFEQVFGEEWMMSIIAGASHYGKVFSEVVNTAPTEETVATTSITKISGQTIEESAAAPLVNKLREGATDITSPGDQ